MSSIPFQNYSNTSTNIKDYTLSEIMAIVGLENLSNAKEIRRKTNSFITKFKKSDPLLSTFFTNIQSQLLQYINENPIAKEDGEKQREKQQEQKEDIVVVGETTKSALDEIYPVGQKQVDDRFENNYLKQADSNQNKKITQRKQKIQIFGNQHVPMSREQLGVNDTFDLTVKQDSLNPNLQNTITRFVNLDSQFRQTSNNSDTSATNYTLDLSDRLNNTLSLCLYSYQIPNSWYVIDDCYKNTCFWITHDVQNVEISIAPGNYSASQFVSALNAAFSAAGFTFSSSSSSSSSVLKDFVEYNSVNGKITLYLLQAEYTPPPSASTSSGFPFTISTDTKLTFFDFSSSLLYEKYSCSFNTPAAAGGGFLNQTLGWIMGFRLPVVPVFIAGNTGEAVLDLNGTKYLILVIDDYNQNHVNNGLVSITELSSFLKMPSYFSPLQPLLCPRKERKTTALLAESNAAFLNQAINANESGLLLAEKYYSHASASYHTTPTLLPSAPRTLTQSQIYTINEINKNKHAITGNFRPKAPTSSNIMAILPLKGGSANIPTGVLLSEFSGSLQQNVRTYFGPVNIDRMAVKLLDDKGNVLNLNGCDWCVTLIATCLYQY